MNRFGNNKLQKPAEIVVTKQQADVTINFLEKKLPRNLDVKFAAAQEFGLNYCIGIIRTKSFNLNLINPIIIEKYNKKISFQETCNSFHYKINCFRYNEIKIKNGFNNDVILLQGKIAIIVQHIIDHFRGKTFHDRSIKLALVRDNGEIKNKDFCPCGSKIKFIDCCKNKITNDSLLQENL
jgi:peptide deformylase